MLALRVEEPRRREGVAALYVSKSLVSCGPTQATAGAPSTWAAISRTSASVTASRAAIVSSGDEISPNVTFSPAARRATAPVLSSASAAW